MTTPQAGAVLESYNGQFFKVVAVRDGLFGRTGFHYKKTDAEADNVVVVWLNQYGLTQVLPVVKATKKTTKKVASSKTETDE